MVAYKLFRIRKRDKSIAPLFIGASSKLVLGEWLQAKNIPTKGYSIRPGWHCLKTPNAPHLSMENRYWFEVEIPDTILSPSLADTQEVPVGGYYEYPMPNKYGGIWLISGEIKIIKKL